ncbi:MAG: glutamate--tRNA ligase [Crocinitomicaceae bacterium]|nr:glutamate--tRNA ligase [Crocinitomicaceae bacterium]
MSKPVRVRFAPSPTGPLHLGGVRTALYNYLFAKKSNGTFIIRVEDTDEKRFVEGAQEYIFESLKWCGIMPTEGPGLGGDKGPYVQSERRDLYRPYMEQLVENGSAYYAFDTPEDLEAMREQAKKMGLPNWQYNAVTRSSMKNSLSLSKEEVQKRLDNGDPYTVRMKMPRNTDVKFEDAIRGWVTVNTNNLDDKVLFKESGMPTYHLANIVDDHLMEISHVIRGEEWLPSAPLHVLLYEAFGWDAPVFAHLPLILRPDGNGKLSKRDGDRLGFPVFPIDWMSPNNEKYTGYREQGYFPEAFVNMLAFLGWNPGTNQEIFSLEELVESFSLERVGKSGARFDPDKTKWFNQQYLRETDNSVLADLLEPYLKEAGISADKSHVERVCGVMKERATFIPDLFEESKFFFQDITDYDEKTVRKKWKEDTGGLLGELKDGFVALDSFGHDEVEGAFSAVLNKNEIGFGKLGPALRLAVTGKGMGPSLFDICEIVGKDKVLERIDIALEKFA